MAKRNDCYTDEEKAEVAAHVLVNVACGRFVSRVFREDATTEDGVKMPHVATFWKWVLQDESGELSDKLVRARDFGVEALLDETIDIADETEFDTVRDDNGNDRPDNEWISRSRLRIETRLKLAAMLKPKKYGAKVDVTSGGEPLREIDETTRAMRLATLINRASDPDADHAG